MKRHFFSKRFYFLLFVLFCSFKIYAQKKQAIGFTLNSEVYPTPEFKLTPGINYELQFTKKKAASNSACCTGLEISLT